LIGTFMRRVVASVAGVVSSLWFIFMIQDDPRRVVQRLDSLGIANNGT